jgi:acetyl esterase/lipase
MRKWLEDVYMPLPKAPRIKRIRSQVAIQITNIPITYNRDNHFSIRIYDPIDKEASRERLRPAVIMLHGGGWIHGHPEVDEGMNIHVNVKN